MNEKKNYNDKILSFFTRFENIVTVLLSSIIALIIIIALIRIIENFYHLFVNDFLSPTEISFEDYQAIFGKIMTLLISLEFLNSILKVLRSHMIKGLIQDVILITALAIARKLIVYDYEHHHPSETIVLAAILVAIGIFYFLIRFERPAVQPKNHEIQKVENDPMDKLSA